MSEGTVDDVFGRLLDEVDVPGDARSARMIAAIALALVGSLAPMSATVARRRQTAAYRRIQHRVQAYLD